MSRGAIPPIAARALQALPEPAEMVSTVAMIAAATHVEREYGSAGYRIGLAWSDYQGGGVFVVVAGDGASFRLSVDAWGNVERVPDADPSSDS